MQNLLKGINRKKALIAVIVVFAYIWVTDFLIHGCLLSKTYGETASLWRPEPEMASYFPWLLLGQLIIAKFFVLIFARGYEGKGIMEGVRFGLLIAPFALAPNLILYAVMPLPLYIIGCWIGLGFLQFVGAGAITAKVYKK